MKTYTLEHIRTERDVDYEILQFAASCAGEVAKIFEHKFDAKKFDIFDYLRVGRLVLCRKDGKLVGAMMSRLYRSIWDKDLKVLYQDLLFSRTKRGTYLLLKEFVDFGKTHADHIISDLTPRTNINPRSLEKLGFVKMEELYRIEVSR